MMDLWAPSAKRAYTIAFFGMALFDRLWSLVGDPFARMSLALVPPEEKFRPHATEEMMGFVQAVDEGLRANAMHFWLEWVVLLAIIGLAVRLRPADWGQDFMPYVVLVSIFLTVGREVLGTSAAFTNPFGAQLAASWLVVLVLFWLVARLPERWR